MKKLFTISIAFIAALFLSFTSVEKTVIVLDVGHGGKDKGVVANDPILEKDITLKIAQKIQQLNDDPNVEIILTRNNDDFMSIEERISFINKTKPNYVISLHANHNNNPNIQGVELFYSENSPVAEESKALALKLKSGLESERKINKMSQANFAVLRKTNSPAVMIEAGFLSNDNDFSLLTSDEGQTEIAKQILLSLK